MIRKKLEGVTGLLDHMRTNKPRGSLLDLFHLDPASLSHRHEIRELLGEYKVDPVVVDWLFYALAKLSEEKQEAAYREGYEDGNRDGYREGREEEE